MQDSTIHMHRLIPGRDKGEYKLGNVIGVCPECHRIVEGLNAQQLYDLAPYGLDVGKRLTLEYFSSNNIQI